MQLTIYSPSWQGWKELKGHHQIPNLVAADNK
jgi:hypothetical protein